jgi:hypothetical protein
VEQTLARDVLLILSTDPTGRKDQKRTTPPLSDLTLYPSPIQLIPTQQFNLHSPSHPSPTGGYLFFSTDTDHQTHAQGASREFLPITNLANLADLPAISTIPEYRNRGSQCLIDFSDRHSFRLTR